MIEGSDEPYKMRRIFFGSWVALLFVLMFDCSRGHDTGYDLIIEDNLEEMDNVPLTFTNPLPSEIKGTLIRNGMGRWKFGKRRLRHLMDGYSKLTKVSFHGNGHALFSTKFTRTQSYNESVASNDIAPYLQLMGPNPPFNVIKRIQAFMNQLDNMNVNVIKIDDFIKSNVITNVYKPHFIGPDTKSMTYTMLRPKHHRIRHGRKRFLQRSLNLRYSKNYFVHNERVESHYVLLDDCTRMYEVDPRSLNVIQKLDTKVKGKSAFQNYFSFASSAHPIKEKGKKSYINFVTTARPLGGSTVTLVRLHGLNSRVNIAEWSMDFFPYMHSFALSENYAVIFNCPASLNMIELIKTVEPVESLDWHGHLETKIVVVNVNTGKKTIFKHKDTGFTMHFANAFEDEGKLFVDAVSYADLQLFKSLQIDILRNKTSRSTKIPANNILKRFTFDLEKNEMSSKSFSSKLQFVNKLDLPIINENFRFENYRYLYGLSVNIFGGGIEQNAIVKKDLKSGNDKYWYEENVYLSEPWFFPKSANGKRGQEDDGYILSIVLDGVAKKSCLVVIDAVTMTTVTKAWLPTRVPWTIHGRFFDEVL